MFHDFFTPPLTPHLYIKALLYKSRGTAGQKESVGMMPLNFHCVGEKDPFECLNGTKQRFYGTKGIAIRETLIAKNKMG